MDFEMFSQYVVEIIEDEIPPKLLEGLNLGVIARPELRKANEDTGRIIMGVYVRNVMGKQVVLYYGSFRKLYQNRPDEFWRGRILSTIKHELTHHVEALAGQEDLARKERYEALRRKNLARLKNKKKRKNSKKTSS